MESLTVKKMSVLGLLLVASLVAMVLYSESLENRDVANPVLDTQVVMQGHDALQIEDNWYLVG